MKIIKIIPALFMAVLCCPESCLDGAIEVQVGSLFKVTAYCGCPKCCGKWSDGVTASGHKIKKGNRFAAADKRIPFGTELVIPGYNQNKPVAVLDRGGVIKGKRIDVFFDTHQEAKEWGVKWLNVREVIK